MASSIYLSRNSPLRNEQEAALTFNNKPPGPNNSCCVCIFRERKSREEKEGLTGHKTIGRAPSDVRYCAIKSVRLPIGNAQQTYIYSYWGFVRSVAAAAAGNPLPPIFTGAKRCATFSPLSHDRISAADPQRYTGAVPYRVATHDLKT